MKSKTSKKATNKTKTVSPILFNGEMRKTFIEGVLQDIKGYFESSTEGKVEITYEDYNLKSYEFGFKLFVKRGKKCSKQMFSETGSAIVNLMNYMFSADEFEKFDLTIFNTGKEIEFELVSNW